MCLHVGSHLNRVWLQPWTLGWRPELLDLRTRETPRRVPIPCLVCLWSRQFSRLLCTCPGFCWRWSLPAAPARGFALFLIDLSHGVGRQLKFFTPPKASWSVWQTSTLTGNAGLVYYYLWPVERRSVSGRLSNGVACLWPSCDGWEDGPPWSGNWVGRGTKSVGWDRNLRLPSRRSFFAVALSRPLPEQREAPRRMLCCGRSSHQRVCTMMFPPSMPLVLSVQGIC